MTRPCLLLPELVETFLLKIVDLQYLDVQIIAFHNLISLLVSSLISINWMRVSLSNSKMLLSGPSGIIHLNFICAKDVARSTASFRRDASVP